MNKFAMVPAPHFSNQSILENIAFGSNKSEIDLSNKTNYQNFKFIKKNKFIERWNIYKIGDKGLKLSGGERQRLVLERALYYKGDNVLDETTSSVDSKQRKKL